MSVVTMDPATRAPASRDRAATDHTDRDREPGPSRLGALLQALAHASALIDPTGVLAAQRFGRW
jgi:hypothetical protein